MNGFPRDARHKNGCAYSRKPFRTKANAVIASRCTLRAKPCTPSRTTTVQRSRAHARFVFFRFSPTRANPYCSPFVSAKTTLRETSRRTAPGSRAIMPASGGMCEKRPRGRLVLARSDTPCLLPSVWAQPCATIPTAGRSCHGITWVRGQGS